MADTTPSTTGEQPSATTTEIAAAGVEPQIDNSAALEALSTADLADLIGGLEDGTAAPENREPEETPEPTQGEPPAEETQDAPPEETPPIEEAPKAPTRLRTGFLPADQQQLVANALELVRKGDSSDIASAIQTLTGSAPQASAATPSAAPTESAPPTQATTPPTPTEAAPTVEGLTAKLTELRAARVQAAVDFQPAEQAALTDQIEDTLAAIHEAKANALLTKNDRISYDSQFDQAVDAMEAKYPDALDESSPFFIVLDAKVATAKANNDPIIKDPNFVIKLADETAVLLGKTATAKPAATPTPPPAPPARAARPTGATVASGHQSVTRPSPDQVRSAMENASLDELAEVAFDK